MPTTTEEIDKLKEILTKYYGVPDSAESWATILGHMCALPAKQIKMPYAHLANPAKRLVINGKLHEQKLVYYDKILKKHEKPAEPQPVTNVTPVTDETKQS